MNEDKEVRDQEVRLDAPDRSTALRGIAIGVACSAPVWIGFGLWLASL